MGDVRLDYAVPAPDLAEFVSTFYEFSAHVPLFEDVERADRAQLRFRLSPGTADYRFGTAPPQRAADNHLIGPTSVAMRVRAEGPVHVFGLGITPAGWAAIVGIDASSVLDRVIDGRDIFGERLAPYAARLRAAAGLDEMAAIGESLVRALIRRDPADTKRFAGHVDAWLAGSASPEIVALTDATGLSRRQVERRCKALYGAPPKLLARKYRALRAAAALAANDAAATAMIADGFYDQSHMIREIKQFAGVTPKQMRERPALLAQLTITRRRALGGRVHRIISDT